MKLMPYGKMLLLTAAILALLTCCAPRGSIVILEDPSGTRAIMDFCGWSLKNKCELSLDKGDVLQVEVNCKYGDIALDISGRKGSEPYMGRKLKSTTFTVTVSETDTYAILIAGKNATGKVLVKALPGKGN
ncbi:MAG TPA: hypothetical protein PK830_08260 [Candidatus Atribacteria bacterium]|nr:hypothetical protein [Candidatus Atribacteria bacterium]HPT79080.1 hypothetical protein [Candidatus Atribacteria bacterium]